MLKFAKSEWQFSNVKYGPRTNSGTLGLSGVCRKDRDKWEKLYSYFDNQAGLKAILTPMASSKLAQKEELARTKTGT